MNGFKKVVLFVKVIICLLAQRTFGNVTHDIVLEYDNLDKWKLCRFEKLSINLKKADLTFRLNFFVKLSNIQRYSKVFSI